MIIDTSAVVAILKDEAERPQFNMAIENADSCLISVATFVEASLVIEVRWGYDGLRDFDLFITRAAIELLPLDVQQAHAARHAFHKYGRGRHAANLNFGDCFSYALAKTLGLPLLFKGNDFSQTDITPAVTI